MIVFVIVERQYNIVLVIAIVEMGPVNLLHLGVRIVQIVHKIVTVVMVR